MKKIFIFILIFTLLGCAARQKLSESEHLALFGIHLTSSINTADLKVGSDSPTFGKISQDKLNAISKYGNPNIVDLKGWQEISTKRDLEIWVFYDDLKFIDFYADDGSFYEEKNVSYKIMEGIKNKHLIIGMDEIEADIVMALKGYYLCLKTNRSVYKWGVYKQKIYGDFGPYLYFENGKLMSWQD